MSTGLVCCPLTRVTQGTTAITQAKALDTLLLKHIGKAENSCVVGLLGLLDPFLVVIAADLPNGLQHQRPLAGSQSFLHLLHCPAIRRTGIVGIVFAASASSAFFCSITA